MRCACTHVDSRLAEAPFRSFIHMEYGYAVNEPQHTTTHMRDYMRECAFQRKIPYESRAHGAIFFSSVFVCIPVVYSLSVSAS